MPTCVEKRLSKTKAGEREGHRPAIGLSKDEALLLFPEPSLGKDIPHEFDCKDHTGRRWQFQYTNRASGPRIRPIEGYLESYLIGPGDTITICAPAKDGHPYTISFAAGDGDPWREGEEVPEPEEEGGFQQILVNRYERNPRNRQAAIQEHGVRCFGCRMEMAEVYGEIAKGYIHIHHVKPISAVQGARPDIKDLVPLCPNCHAIVHLENPPVTIKRLKELIRQRRPS